MDRATFEQYWTERAPITAPDLELTVNLPSNADGGFVRYIAAAPADGFGGFTGSGLPFGTLHQAFENTPNSGRADAIGGVVRLSLLDPNTFYSRVGTVRTAPTVYISYVSRGVDRFLAAPAGPGVPFRDLTYPRTRTGPEFYAAPRVVMSQYEKILPRNYPTRPT